MIFCAVDIVGLSGFLVASCLCVLSALYVPLKQISGTQKAVSGGRPCWVQQLHADG